MELHNVRFWRVVLAGTSVFSLIALIQLLRIIQAIGADPLHSKWTILLLLVALGALIELSLLGFTWTKRGQDWVQVLEKRISSFSRSKKVMKLLSFVLVALFPYFILASPLRGILTIASNRYLIIGGWQGTSVEMIDMVGRTFVQGGPREELATWGLHWWLFWLCGLFASLCLRAGRSEFKPKLALLIALLSQALIFKVISYLSSISSYPFALSWEESYRIYYASLLAAKRLYGLSWPLSQIDFTLNLLNGIPFLVGNLPIWIHRMWYVILLLCITILTAFSLCRRLEIRDWLSRWLFIGWCILYILQMGGIHYEVLIIVIIILFGFSINHPWRSLVSIVLASIWAGMSRLNWYPVPAMLAVALFFLEEPLNNYRNAMHYLLKPILWGVIGLITAIFGGLLVSYLTGINDVATLKSWFTSLLWYRLLPNPTYPLGILPAITLVSLPLWWICFNPAKGQWRSLRIFWLTAMTLTLLAGGVIVSIKIGGGSDLHNLDAYLILLVIVAAYIFFNRFEMDTAIRIYKPAWPVVALAVVIPLWSAIHTVQPYVPFDRLATDRSLQALKTKVEQASAQGEILFTHQRQLLAFGYIHIPLVSEYEDVFLLEMALEQNQAYLDQFYVDLSNHRFQLIVAESQPEGLRGKSFPFGEENDVWFTAITQPLLCEYESGGTLQDDTIGLYAPRPTPGNCNFNIP